MTQWLTDRSWRNIRAAHDRVLRGFVVKKRLERLMSEQAQRRLSAQLYALAGAGYDPNPQELATRKALRYLPNMFTIYWDLTTTNM